MRLIKIQQLIAKALPGMEGVYSIKSSFEELPGGATTTTVDITFHNGECYRIEVRSVIRTEEIVT